MTDDEPSGEIHGDHFHFETYADAKAYVKRAREDAYLSIQAGQHEVELFLQSLDAEQLNTLRKMIGSVMTMPPKMAINQLTLMFGDLHRLYATKAELCPVCGVNHDKALVDLVAEEHNASQAQQASTEFQQTAQRDAMAEFAASCAEYGVTPGPDGTVVCSKCGWSWTNLADRMMGKPGVAGCPQCIDIAKHG